MRLPVACKTSLRWLFARRSCRSERRSSTSFCRFVPWKTQKTKCFSCRFSKTVLRCGVFWTKFEHFLTKIRIPNFKIQSLGRAKRKGVGGKEFLPALAFRFQFLSAAAEFRASETGTPPILIFQSLFLFPQLFLYFQFLRLN